MVDQLHQLPGRASLPLFVRNLVLACTLAGGAVLVSVLAASAVVALWEVFGLAVITVLAALLAGSLAVSRLVCRRR